MPVSELRVAGYRSVREVTLRLARLNLVVGPNGCGKTNLYRAMQLLAQAASGQLSQALADEGGMPSALWAGPRDRGPVRLTVGVTVDDFRYDLSCGLPLPDSESYFSLDPEVKEESVKLGKAELLQRKNAVVWVRDGEGRRERYMLPLQSDQSVLAQLREPHRYPELSMLHQEFLSWRFYHHFRTDAASPLRQPQVGVRTPALAHDGRDLAAALATILEVGDGPGLRKALDDAFPGARLQVIAGEQRFQVYLQMPDFKRPFGAAELSDGTLHYLCLLAALLSSRPPGLLALNEPEGSVHPDLIPALARLLVQASQTSQVWVTTHSRQLCEEVQRLTGTAPVALRKVEGATALEGEEDDLVLKIKSMARQMRRPKHYQEDEDD